MKSLRSQDVESLEPRQLFSAAARPAVALVPRFDHVVIVMEENKAFGEILGRATIPPPAVAPVSLPLGQLQDPFLRGLARHSAVFTNSHAVAHPSQPNYLALFSGSTQNVNGDAVPSGTFSQTSLGGELLGAGYSFAGYSESLPHVGYTGTDVGVYKKAHNPWSDFADVPATSNLPFSQFPHNFDQLPTVSFVVPNTSHDMHSSTIAEADQWLQHNLQRYAGWARTHNSLLIVTWDESSGLSSSNQIPTLIEGAHLRSGQYSQYIDHYSMLRTIEDMYGLTPLGASANASAITNIWKA